jgi:GNAT superfamily N-acetyltransferase
MHAVRQARPSDAEAIATLVRSLVAESLVDPESDEARRFYAAIAPEEIAKFIVMPNRFYAIAEVGGAVQGMIMVRDANYIGQFFVSRVHQSNGMGSALWAFAQEGARVAGASGEFTVRSSVAAEPVYRRFGFLPTGPVEVQQGFKFIPMRRQAGGAA